MNAPLTENPELHRRTVAAQIARARRERGEWIAATLRGLVVRHLLHRQRKAQLPDSALPC